MAWNRRSASPVQPGGSASAAQQVGDAGGVGQYVQLAPWTDPPIGNVPLFLSAKAATVGVNDAQTPAGLSRVMGANEQGVIRGFVLMIENPTPLTTVFWTLLVNGVAVDGVNGVTILGRAAASISRPLSILVFVPPRQRVSVSILNVDGGAYNVGADIEGWTYQIKSPQKKG